jgi:DNA polymerase I
MGKRRTAEEKLTEVLNRLPHAKRRCVDVETSGLDWKTNFICGYVVTFSPRPQDSFYIPVRHRDGGNLGGKPGPRTATGWDGKLHPGEAELLRLLDESGTVMFGHNIQFDLKFLWKTSRGKMRFRPRIEDTMIAAPLLNEWQGKFTLEFCAENAGVQAKKSKEIIDHIMKQFPEAVNPKDAMGHYWRLRGDDPMAVEYAEGDGTSTWQLLDAQYPMLKSQELMKVWDIESRLIPVLARMSCKGIRIDEERLDQLSAYVDGKIEHLMNAFPSGFNARSPPDVRNWMEQHGRVDWPMTKPSKRFPEGTPSMIEEWLATHPEGRDIIAVRKFETLKSSFIQPMKTEHLFKGRVHTNYNQLKSDNYGTITGRLSSSNPNLQQVPKHNQEIGRLFRAIFIPDDGYIWASADYSQMEPRLLAYYSRCRVLLDGYWADPPIDAHTSASMGACGSRWDAMSKEERKKYRDDVGKRFNQTIISGGGKAAIVRKYGVDPREVDHIWNSYFSAMPEIRQLQKQSTSVMFNRGYVRSLLGRRARLIDRDRAYTAINRLLQCGNADVIKLKMAEIDEYLENIGRPIDVLNNIHDDLAFQFPEEYRQIYYDCIGIMTDFGDDAVIPLDVPITVDTGEGPNWAIATYGEEE